MSRYVDAEKLIEEIENCSYDTWSKDVNRAWWSQAVMVKDNIKQCIKRQSTADVLEVVRCKDCKHWGGVTYGQMCRKYSGADTKVCTEKEHYCSYGERRGECKPKK
jgi:hypothetical protein